MCAKPPGYRILRAFRRLVGHYRNREILFFIALAIFVVFILLAVFAGSVIL